MVKKEVLLYPPVSDYVEKYAKRHGLSFSAAARVLITKGAVIEGVVEWIEAEL